MTVAPGLGPVSVSMVSSVANLFSPRSRQHTGSPGSSDTFLDPFLHGRIRPAPTLKSRIQRISPMQVQVNTGNGLENKETLERWADEYLNEALARFNQEITRVEVQLTDESGKKAGAADMRCMLEARLNGHAPLAVNHHGATQDEAFRGATQRLINLLEHTLGKLDRHEHRSRDTIRKDSSIVE
jgi:hypothetical protein